MTGKDRYNLAGRNSIEREKSYERVAVPLKFNFTKLFVEGIALLEQKVRFLTYVAMKKW